MADRRVTLTLDLDISRALADVNRVESALSGVGSRASAKASIGDSIARDAEKAAKEVQRINAATVRQAEQNDRLLERSATTLANVQIREAKRGATALIAEIEKTRTVEAEVSGGGIFASAFGGAALGAGAGAAAFSFLQQIPIDAIAAARSIFDLTKSASDFGSVIKDAQDKTGLQAATLQGLAISAKTSGSSFEAVSGAISKFSKLVGEAEKGNQQATASLARFGLTPQAALADLDGSLGKVFATINKLPPGIAQMSAAQSAFGKSGAELVPVIKDFGGDLEALKKHASDLGVVLSSESITAADNFGDTLDVVKYQVEAVSAKFALQFAPVITQSLTDVSKFLGENAATFEKWGTDAGDAMRALRAAVDSDFVHSAETLTLKSAAFFGNTNPYIKTVYDLTDAVFAYGKSLKDAEPTGVSLKDALGGVDFNALGDAVLDQSPVNKAIESEKELKESIESVTQALLLQKAQFAATQSANANASPLTALVANAGFDKESIDKQLQLLQEQRSAKIRALTQEQLTAGEGTEITKAADPEIYKLLNQEAILRLNTEKAINDEIKKQATAALDTYKNLLVTSNPDNPFVKIFQDGSTALDKLRRDLRDFSPEIVKQFTDLQQKANFRNLFSAQLDTALGAFDLRERASALRAANNSPNNDNRFLNNQDFLKIAQKIPDAARFLGADNNFKSDGDRAGFALKYLRGDLEDPVQKRLNSQLDIINSAVNRAPSADREAALALADKSALSISAGLKPDEINSRQREQIAGAAEREAGRKEAGEKQALALQIDSTAATKSLDANLRRITALFDAGKGLPVHDAAPDAAQPQQVTVTVNNDGANNAGRMPALSIPLTGGNNGLTNR